jgi:hypothetical protein
VRVDFFRLSRPECFFIVIGNQEWSLHLADHSSNVVLHRGFERIVASGPGKWTAARRDYFRHLGVPRCLLTRGLGDTPWNLREFVMKDCDGRLLAFGANP